MKNTIPTKFHTCCLLVLIMLATACGEVKAEPIGSEICVPYTKNAALMVAAQRVDSAQESQRVEKELRRFLKTAQDGAKHVFDWSYLGKASGEILSSSQFGAYVQRQRSGTK